MKKILIISIISGLGHLKAAQSVEKALKKFPNKVEIKHINVLDFVPYIYTLIFKFGYTFITKNFPSIYYYLYNKTNQFPQPRAYIRRKEKDYKKCQKLLKFILEFNPDIIVSVHYFPTQLVSEFKKEGRIKCKLVAICTDYGIHSYLLQDKVDTYILPNEIVKKQLLSFGFKNEILTYGIPADPFLKNKIDVKKTRKEFNLAEDLNTIIFFFCANYKVNFVHKIFEELNKITIPFQVIATGGRNENFLKVLNSLKERYEFTILPIGITNRIYDLMKISDVNITKPGGLTTAESLICGLPMILLNPIPGQEEKNADMLVQAGAAIKLQLSELQKLALIVENLFKNKKKFENMKRAALKLAKPNASDDIANYILKS